MICVKCSHNIPEGSRFCEKCGAPVSSELPDRKPVQTIETIQNEKLMGKNAEAVHEHPNQQVSPGVVMDRVGIMRWVYEMNMWKNPTLIITIWKVLLLAALLPALLIFFLGLEDGLVPAFFEFIKIFGMVICIVSGLMLLAYPLVAIINGGKYCVVFEMDDNGVKHTQMQKQFKKSQVLSMLVVLAGVMTGNIQATAAGMLAGSKQSSLSSFEKVKSITVNEKRHVIYVNEKLSHNQVYADTADFAFVRDHIISHCKKAKVTYK